MKKTYLFEKMQPLFTVYAGVLTNYRYGGKQRGFQVVFQSEYGAESTCKTFAYHHYKSEAETYMAALEFKQVESDSRGWTTEYYPSFISEDQKSYFAGIMDGDGCISVNKAGAVCVSLSQAQNLGIPECLSQFETVYKGIIESRDRSLTKRKTHTVRLSGLNALSILYDMAHYGVLKAEQARLVLDYMMKNNCSVCPPLYEHLRQMKSISEYQKVQIDPSCITLAYCAGLFDAEGCIICYGCNVTIDFAQKASFLLLENINQFFNNSGQMNSTKERLYFGSQNACAVLKQMLPFLIVKRDQAICALELRELVTVNYHHRTTADQVKIKELNAKIKCLKRI